MSFCIDYDLNTVLVNNTNSYKIVDNEFTHEDKTYTIFNFTTTLVKHKQNSVSESQTQYFDVPLIMEKEKAIQIVKDIANISQYQLSLSDKMGNVLGNKDDLVKTLDRIKDQILDELQNHDNSVDLNENFKEIVRMIFTYAKNYNADDMIKSLAAANVSKFSIVYDEINISKILGDLTKYISYHNTYHEQLINKRGFTIYPDALFMIIIINTLMSSTLPTLKGSINMNSIESMLLHALIEMMVSITTMKLDKEMFINERNHEATKIKRRYFSKFPTLKNGDVEQIKFALNSNKAFKEMLESESISLYPFIMFYGQPDKVRITQCYEACKAGTANENIKNQINWIAPSKFYDLLVDFCNKHSDEFSRYDSQSFETLISTFSINGTKQIISSAEVENMEY